VDVSGDSTVEATVVQPEGDSYSQTLNAVSPGVYKNSMSMADEGIYTMFVQQTGANGDLLAYRQATAAASYSSEYDAFLDGGNALLKSVRNLAGGDLMGSGDELFNIEMLPSETEKDLYIPLAILSAFLLLADLVMRNAKWKDLKAFFVRKRVDAILRE
jgi:hypothetical protein